MLAVSSGWAKPPPDRTRSKAVNMRELEAWEKRRREKASEIEARRRVERAAASHNRLPAGYGRNGALPEYIQAHLLSLQASPLGKPAGPCATVHSLSSTGKHRRHVQKTGWVPDETVVPGHQTSPSPEKHRRQIKTGVVASTAIIAATSGHPIQRGRLTSSAESRQGRQLHAQPITKVSGLKHNKHERPAPVAFLIPCRADLNIRNVDTISRGVGRPTSAPSAPGRKSRRTLSGGSGQQGNYYLVPYQAGIKEAELLEKLGSLMCLRPDNEFPTVAALRTAVTIETIHMQLRECRKIKVGGGSKAAAGPLRQGASTTAVPDVHRLEGEARADIIWRAAPRCRGGIEPWDNWSPFVSDNSSYGRTIAGRVDRPMSAPALRILASNDPVFSNVDEYRNGRRRRRHPSPSQSPLPPEKIATNDDEESAPNGHCFSQTPQQHDKEGEYPEATRRATTNNVVAAIRKVEACSRRLTVGALIELSNLRNPPEPVRAVQAALACLLGWQQGKPSRDPVSSAPRSLFSNAYLLRNVLSSVCPQRIPGSRLSMLEKRLRLQEVVPARVRGANAAAAVLLEWLLAVVACARAEVEQRCAQGELR